MSTVVFLNKMQLKCSMIFSMYISHVKMTLKPANLPYH